MAVPIPLLAAGAAALWFLTRKESAYAQAPADGSKPAKKEPPPPAKTWREMPPALQEQVAAVLGELGVSPATGELTGAPVSSNAIAAATQTAALCESQGFYDIAKDLRRYAEGAVRQVPTPPAAKEIEKAAPPGLSPAEREAIARTIAMDRDPKVLQALLVRLLKLPSSPERDNYVQMLEALILQLAAAQTTTQTMQQIDQVIRSPGIAEVQQAVQPLPPAAIPVVTPAPGKPIDQGAPDNLAQHQVTSTSPGVPQKPPPLPTPPSSPASLPPPAPVTVKLADIKDPAPTAPLLYKGMPKTAANVAATKSWQGILKAFGYNLGTSGPNKDGVDGDFGTTTDARTREFQAYAVAHLKLPSKTADGKPNVDGKVGPITRRVVVLRTAVQKGAVVGAARRRLRRMRRAA